MQKYDIWSINEQTDSKIILHQSFDNLYNVSSVWIFNRTNL